MNNYNTYKAYGVISLVKHHLHLVNVSCLTKLPIDPTPLHHLSSPSCLLSTFLRENREFYPFHRLQSSKCVTRDVLCKTIALLATCISIIYTWIFSGYGIFFFHVWLAISYFCFWCGSFQDKGLLINSPRHFRPLLHELKLFSDTLVVWWKRK